MSMRKMKKVMILMLSFVMVFQNCLGAFAAQTVSVSENTVSQNDVSEDVMVSSPEEVTEKELTADEKGQEVKSPVEIEEIAVEGAGSSFATATSIATNTSYQGKIAQKWGKDYYKFTLPSDGVISLTISHELFADSSVSENEKWRLYLYNASQSQIDHMTSSSYCIESATGSEIGLPKGTYYVMVEDAQLVDYISRTYTLRVNYTASSAWEKEFNNNWITANQIRTNYTYYGAITEDDTADYYKFTLPEDGAISLSISHEWYESADVGWYMVLSKPNGSSYEKVYDMNSSTGYFETKCGAEIGLEAGTYYLYVKKQYGGNRTYSFLVSYQTTEDFETEFNDSWLTADNLAEGILIFGSNMSNYDVDYYKFNMTESGYIKLTFWHMLFDSSDKGWLIELYDSNHNEIDNFYSSEGNRSTGKYIQKYLKKGKYYIVIRESYSCDNQEKTYYFRVNAQPKKGSVVTINNMKYKVTDNSLSSPKVECVGPSSKNITSATIESTVTINNFKYNVTKIKSSAFKNCKKLKKITIGSNVKTIGSKAFYNCKKLKSITIKSKKITKVGKNALKGIYKKAKIKCPKSKLSKYKKLFANKGQKSTVKFK